MGPDSCSSKVNCIVIKQCLIRGTLPDVFFGQSATVVELVLPQLDKYF